MDWDRLRIFHAVADAGSLTHAGDVPVSYTHLTLPTTPYV